METRKARIEYLLSEAGRKKSLLAGGDGRELQAIETDATPEIIDLAKVDEQGNILLQVGFYTYHFDRRKGDFRPQAGEVSKSILHSYADPGWRWNVERKIRFFDELQTTEALVVWEKARVQNLANAETNPENLAEIARFEAEYQAEKARKEAQREAEKLEREAEEAERETKKARREQEKVAWIAAHGSDYLRRATKLGYDCQRQYVMERAGLELSDFQVDFDNQARWRSRACPSEEALGGVEQLIAQGYEAECVWLTAYWEENDPDYFEECEAIVISNYLGRYELVKIV